MATLINITPGSKKEVIPMNRVVLLVGHGEGEIVNLEQGKLTQNHASIVQLEDGFYYLRDHGSNAGSFLNEEPVVERRLEHLDVVRFGPYQLLVDLKGQFQEPEAESPAVTAQVLPRETVPLRFSIADDEPWETVEQVTLAYGTKTSVNCVDLSQGPLPDEPMGREIISKRMKMMVVTSKEGSSIESHSRIEPGPSRGNLQESPVYLQALENSLKPKCAGASALLGPLGKREENSLLRKSLEDSLEGDSLSGRWGIGKPGFLQGAG